MSNETREFVDKIKAIASSSATPAKMIHSLRSAGLEIMEGQDSSYLPMIQDLCTEVFPNLNPKEVEHLKTKLIKRISISDYCTTPSGHGIHQSIVKNQEHEFSRLRIVVLSLMYGQENLVHKTLQEWITDHSTELERFPAEQSEGMDRVIQLRRGTTTPVKRRASTKALEVASKIRASSATGSGRPVRQKSATIEPDDGLGSDGSDTGPFTTPTQVRRSAMAQAEASLFIEAQQAEPTQRPWKLDDSAFRPKSGLTNLQRIAMDASRALPPLVPPQAPTPSPEQAAFPFAESFSSATVNERVSGDEVARDAVRDAAGDSASWTDKIQQHVHGIVDVVVGVIQDKAKREKKKLKGEVVSLQTRLSSVEEDIATYKRLLARRSSENGNRS